jgi:VanZ family protein
VWSLAILFFTSIPNPQVNAPQNSDKVFHFGVYAVLGFLAGRAANLRRERVGAILVAVSCLTLFGAIDEFHQRFIPGRSAAVDDWLADSLGGLVGTTVAVLSTFRRPQSA